VWQAWHESGRVSHLDAVGVAELERLIRLHDDAEGEGWPVPLTSQIRMLESRLLRSAPQGKQSDDDARREQRSRQRVDRREAPDNPSTWSELTPAEVAKCELSVLLPNGAALDVTTPAGRRACIQAYDTPDAGPALHN
jgi:hypothetical protein